LIVFKTKFASTFPLGILVAFHVKADTEIHLLNWQLLCDRAGCQDPAFQGFVPTKKSLIGLVCATRTLNIH
jgi:hypothetical protein